MPIGTFGYIPPELFEEVLRTAERLAQSQAQVEIARAAADKAKAEADKARAEADKAKTEATKTTSGESVKKVEEELKALKDKLVDAAIDRISSPEDQEEATAPTGEGKKQSKPKAGAGKK